MSRRFLTIASIGGQAMLALSSVVMLRVQPPAEGSMLLVPLGSQTQGELAAFALSRGLTLAAAGDREGSLVVRGERARLGWALRDHGILVLASDVEGCAPS
jgi:hypothetical protein